MSPGDRVLHIVGAVVGEMSVAAASRGRVSRDQLLTWAGRLRRAAEKLEQIAQQQER